MKRVEPFMEYAFVTVEHQILGKIDIKISRKLQVKYIISQLFEAVLSGGEKVGGSYLKAVYAEKLLYQSDTLEIGNIYDGELLRII